VSQQHHTRRHAGSGSTPFTEKIRRRLWGTDNPPGLADPYGGEGVIAKQWNKQKAKYTGEKEDGRQINEKFEELDVEDAESWADYNRPLEPFVPATNAHDLKRLGFVGEWTDFPPTESDEYHP
jgi:hypothetical protein